MTFIDTQFIKDTEGEIENKRKRYVIYKYLPFVTKRRIIRKPLHITSDCECESEYDNVEPTEPMSFVALHIIFEPPSINNETFHTQYTLSCDTDSSPYTYQLPVIPIDAEEGVSNYKKMIREYLLSEFGIVQKYISKIQYVNQHIHNDIYYINVYRIELSACHKYFPVRPFSRYKDPYHIENDPMTDVVVCTEDKRAKFHKYLWHWKVVMYLTPYSTSTIELFERIMMDKHKTAEEKWDEYVKGIPHVREEVKCNSQSEKVKTFVNINHNDREIRIRLSI